MGKGKDCGCGCEGRGGCGDKEDRDMADEMNEARGRNRMVVRGGRLIRTKKTSIADKQQSRKYYRKNKRRITMRRAKRMLKPEFRRNQRINDRKKASLGMAEDIGGLVEDINDHLNGGYQFEGDDYDDEDGEMDEQIESVEDVLEELEAQLAEAEELASEFEGTEFGESMEVLADHIAENIERVEEGEIDDLDEALDMLESADAIFEMAESLIE